jgi:tRNA threonylcarbamoyladenosine modification (KEOPS) complex Cgi121 subunit
VYSIVHFSRGQDPKDFRDCALVREDRVIGNMHIDTAIKYALGNYRAGRMISKSLWNEILLYVSVQRQVHMAFELVGVKNFSGKVIRVSFSGGKEELPVIEVNGGKMKYWNVRSPVEILEKMALFHIDNF